MACPLNQPRPDVLLDSQTPEGRPLPRTFSEFRGFHAGETILVCGCGSSLSQVVSPERCITIGVNDVGRLFQPDYLVVLNPKEQFRADRFRFVEESRARAVFTQLKLGIRHPHIVPIRLGKLGGVDFSDSTCLPYTRNSPYVAICLAIHMGAKRIGLIGVDFTDHHFFARTGQHPLTRQFPQIDQEYKRLYDACRRLDIEVFNLSASSRLTGLPKMSLEEFVPRLLAKQSLDIVSYSTTPVAGVPAILSRCIASRTAHKCRTVWATNTYSNGVAFDGDVEWSRTPAAAEDLLRSADLVIVHNGKVEARHRPLLRNKPVITMAHNYMWNVDPTFVCAGFPGVVVGQYQATLADFRGWHVVPNPVPLWEPPYRPEEKDSLVTICFTPSGKHESYPPSHRLYWHSKGYQTTMKVLDNLAKRFPLRLEVIRDRQVSHAESLAMKRRAHIVIDECVTGSYHRNSLEGLACGCVVINGIGLLPDVAQKFRYCANNALQTPFVFASLDTLETALVTLIASGSEALVAQGIRNRAFMEQHWDFSHQWLRYWEPIVTTAMKNADERSAAPVSSAVQTTGRETMPYEMVQEQLKQGLSVVICHGGEERLPHLRASLANLRQCSGVSEMIVVDMGHAPYAQEVARRWADKYMFVRNDDVFERARCMNIGTALAEYDLVLWKDNDLMLPPDFITNAVAEMRTRRLNYLVPYACVNYLSAPDSLEVMHGTRNPADCRAMKTLRAIREVSGGAGLVRKSFVLQYGGMSEDFRGWGGEDTAWWFKARLLGPADGTQQRDQQLFHLFHPHSGNYGGSAHMTANPYYSKNVALLKEMCAIRDRNLFVKRFPPHSTLSRMWGDKRIVFVAQPSSDQRVTQIARMLTAIWDIKIDCRIATDSNFPWKDLTSEPHPDSVVIFGAALAKRFLSDDSLEGLRPKTVVACDGSDSSEEVLHGLQKAGAVWNADASAVAALKRAGLRPWGTAGTDGGSPNPLSTGLSLIQPLSIILGGAGTAKPVPTSEPSKQPSEKNEQTRLPVWMYWEGECPEWIRKCQETVFAHAADVRLLSPTDFDKLRDGDRDIDLKRLHVAHRADYIRAFLLARYGGLWIDSDCLVMQSLGPTLDSLRDYDFMAHRERSGYVANNFIAARPGSKIAGAFYKRICDTLRSRKPLGWISLGGEPLTELLKATDVGWCEIESEIIEPIGWDNPGAFFAVNSSSEHQRLLNRRAICYLLSNCEVQRFQAANPSRTLLEEGTFFNYLVSKALDKDGPAAPASDEVLAMPKFQHIPFCIDAVVELAPTRVLDVGVGLGRWGMLIREFCEGPNPKVDREHWKVHLEGIQPFEESSQKDHLFFYDHVHAANGNGIAERIQDRWDLVIIADMLERWPKEVGSVILERALETADYVLVDSPIATGMGRNGNGHWSVGDFLAKRPVRLTVYNHPAGAGYGTFLLSRNDPKHLKTSPPMEKIFGRILEEYRPIGDESLSGPGSTLSNTVEIRQALPLLVEDLGALSLLDAPCGDFNWMSQVRLAVEDYTGVDVIPCVIEQNQKRYTTPGRQFINLDLTRDPLPEADLILCRDCLTHFSYEDIFCALRNFKRSKSKYLLATTYVTCQTNRDIATGGWRPLSFQGPPFHFPVPLRIINEKCKEDGGKYSDKTLALWDLKDIP